MRFFHDIVSVAAAKHGVPLDLLHSVADVESAGVRPTRALAYRHEPAFHARYIAGRPEFEHGDPRRVSASYGHFQIMYPTAWDYGYRGYPEGLCAPEVGADLAGAILSDLLRWSGGDVSAAVAAYNGGRGVGRVAPFRNQSYVDKVRAAQRAWKGK